MTRSLLPVVPQAFAKLDPRHVYRSPVIFVVWVGSVLTTGLAARDPSVFSWSVAVWLWLTVLFANAAEAVAEGRGKAQAARVRLYQGVSAPRPANALPLLLAADVKA